MQLADVAAVATVVALLILAYVHAKPAINRWATVKFLRVYSEIHWDDLLAPERARALPLPRRLRRWRRNRVFLLTQRLMARAHRIAQHDLLEQLRAALNDGPAFLPPRIDCDPLVAEAAVVAKHDWNRRQARHRARVHKEVVCAGGCGTKYGKRRKDHSFSGGGDIDGGWLCPTNISCLREPTGEHYCGMCTHSDWLSTIRGNTDPASHGTRSPSDTGSAITMTQGPTEAADERESEQQSLRSARRPPVERSAGPATVDGDATPVPTNVGNAPANRRG